MHHPRLLVSALVALLVLQARTAAAQSSPETLRTQLVAQAAGARDRGQHPEAVRLLRAALSIRSSPGTRWALAFELHEMGELQAARQEAEACVGEATGAGPDAITARDECTVIVARVRDRLQATAPAPADPVTLPPSVSPLATPIPATPHPVVAQDRAR